MILRLIDGEFHLKLKALMQDIDGIYRTAAYNFRVSVRLPACYERGASFFRRIISASLWAKETSVIRPRIKAMPRPWERRVVSKFSGSARSRLKPGPESRIEITICTGSAVTEQRIF